MTPYKAYVYALGNYTKHNFDLDHYQEIACKSPDTAYYFALRIPGANIEYCRKTFEHDEYWLDRFDQMIIEKAML